MATWKDIENANKLTTTTDIKGTDYVEVNQRVKAFRMVYPNGRIETEIVSNENGVVIMKAHVFDGDNNLLSTGCAYEKEGNGFINKTSYIENCETSAVGRALGFCGFGIDSSIASKEEVENAKLQQKQMDAPKKTNVKNTKKNQTTNDELYQHSAEAVKKVEALKMDMDSRGIGHHEGEQYYNAILKNAKVKTTNILELKPEELERLCEVYIALINHVEKNGGK